MSVLARKLLGIAVGVALLGVLLGLYVANWVTNSSPSVAAVSAGGAGTGKGSQLTLETVQTIGRKYSPAHPAWVSYLVLDHRRWVHSGEFIVPAHSLVHVTVYEFDVSSRLRNPVLAQVQGTVGGVETFEGKPIAVVNPEEISHTFAVPQLGLFVPLPAFSGQTNKPPCEVAPCSTSQAHSTITFTFRTHGRGRYRWQCFVPCGIGYPDGNGGPMQTLGYMDGFLDVV